MMTIAAASFKEALRKKIILLVGIITVVYLGLFTMIMYLAYDEARDTANAAITMLPDMIGMVSVLGFYFSSMIAAFLTIMSGIGAVSSEIENGSIQTIVTKPIRRRSFIFGKYLGVAGLSAAFAGLLYVFIIVVNVVIGIPPLCRIDAMAFIKGLLLFWFETWTLLALCIYGSVMLRTLNNGILIIGIYILGMIGSIMEQVAGVLELASLEKWGIFLSLVSPFDSLYRLMVSAVFTNVNWVNVEAGPLFVGGKMPSVWMMVYAGIYLLGFLYLAVRKFERKDI